jgi:hypothetical protein
MAKKLRMEWAKGNKRAIQQATKNFNAQLTRLKKAEKAFHDELEKMGKVAWDNLPLDDQSFPDEITDKWDDSHIGSRIAEYDKRIEKAVNDFLHGEKRATGAMMRKKMMGNRKNPPPRKRYDAPISEGQMFKEELRSLSKTVRELSSRAVTEGKDERQIVMEYLESLKQTPAVQSMRRGLFSRENPLSLSSVPVGAIVAPILIGAAAISKDPKGLHIASKEEVLKWWSQGLSLGLIRWDGKILQWPDAKRWANWWLHGFTLGVLKVEKPIGIEPGQSIVDLFARCWSLGIASYGDKPTSILTENPKYEQCNSCGHEFPEHQMKVYQDEVSGNEIPYCAKCYKRAFEKKR